MLGKIIKFSLYLLLILAGGLFFVTQKYPEANFYVKQILGIAPCQKPLTYSLGDFDAKFGITKSDFLSATDEASQVWEKTINKNLFKYSSDGKLKISLTYDYRQEATDKLKSLGFTIDNTKGSYDALKLEYTRRVAIYNSDKSNLDQLVNEFKTLKQKYDSAVSYWNSHGGAPEKTYNSLQSEKTNLQNLAQNINDTQTTLNNEINEINALTDSLNQVARQINVGVQTYNKIGASTGEEFSEGLYISDVSGTRIEVYQFNNRAQLVRLLAHELGHALGLEHVDNPNAIMYKLNESKNLTPTKNDVTELKTACHIK